MVTKQQFIAFISVLGFQEDSKLFHADVYFHPNGGNIEIYDDRFFTRSGNFNFSKFKHKDGLIKEHIIQMVKEVR